MSELALQLIEYNKETKDTFLDLGSCGLEFRLPQELLECVWIKRLNLGSYYYESKQNKWVESKNKKSLNIFHGQELTILENLPQLQALDLNYNQIQEINFVKNLKQLISLDLSYNQIQDYSFLKNLTQLIYLDVSGNQIQEISFVKNLAQLIILNLSYNKIHDISSLQNLTKLTSLNLSFNKIYEISFLQNLILLTSLNLSYNQIQEITLLKNLSVIQSLELRSNQIQDIEPLKLLFKNGLEINLEQHGSNGIVLYNNPINNPPMGIVEQGREVILRYFSRIRQQENGFIFEAKLTLVGDGGSGKTSLQRRILDNNAELPKGNDRTRGIKVHDWKFKDAEGNIYTTHIWNFGGQDVYYPIHRFFLTDNSVYILMASTRYAVNNFEYWIPIINQSGGNSPVIIVQNCNDGIQKEWHEIRHFYEIPEYNLLKPIFKIDLSSPDNWGLKTLKEFIQHQITKLGHIGKPVPKSWVKVRLQLVEKAVTNDYMSFEEFSDLCIETDNIAFNKTVEIEVLAHFLHDLGIILWYSNKVLLRNFIILKPEWAMNAVYQIIDDTIIQQQNGIINQADFKRIWGKETYQAKIDELKLMLQVFKIAFPKQQQKQDYIIPARLQSIPDDKLWKNVGNFLRLEYLFNFMPRGIVNQLSAELSDKVLSDENLWSDAVILEHNSCSAQVIEEVHKKKILIKAKGNDARELMLLIINSISDIVHEYRGIAPSIRVPCNCKTCQMLENPTIFEYEKLIDWLNSGRRNVICSESDTKLSISQLINSVGLKNIEYVEEKLIINQKETKQKESISQAKKVFVTYCWTDKYGKNDTPHQTKVHSLVNALRKKGIDATFDKALNDLSTSNNFIRMMVDNIHKSEKVIVVLSEGYAIKANEFKGGAGEEYELIINDITENTKKYILVTFSGRSKEIYPFGLKGRDTIDLSSLAKTEIDSLIRKIKDIPSVILDDLGTDTDSYNPTSAPPLF